VSDFVFHPQIPQPWPGRFPGQTHIGHFFVLKNAGSSWQMNAVMERNGALVFCPLNAGAGMGARALSAAVREASDFLGLPKETEPRFLVNEFAQLLVAGPPGQACLAGEAEGPFLFQDPESSNLMDLSSDESLEPGDPWLLPASGCPYELSRKSRVYFQDPGGKQVYPKEQDWELVETIRDLIPDGPASFVVNPCGLVILEANGNNGEGKRSYAGRIRPEFWFEREEGR
jgi:hypothetical protein